MNKRFILLLLGLIFIVSSIFSVDLNDKDNVAYGRGETSFTKTRQVAQRETSASICIGTTNVSVTLPNTALSILIINDHASNTLYVNPDGLVALNIDGSDAYTTDGGNVIDLNTSITVLDLQVGDLIVLDEGDANDGLYVITSFIPNTNKIRVDKDCNTTNSATQDYVLKSFPVEAGESIKIDVGTRELSLVSDASDTTVRIIITYQRGS